MRVFVSTFLYALAKVAAHAGADVEATIQQALASGSWECGRSMSALGRALKAIPGASHEVWLDSTTTIGKARSRAAFAFLATDADVWVSVDDDAEVDEATIALLLRATHHATEPRIVMIPQKLADGRRVNVNFLTVPPEPSRTVDGKRLVPVDFAGCSIMAANRVALDAMRANFPELACDEQQLIALFLEEVRNGFWWGEDKVFCERAQLAGLEVEILLDVPSVHAGHELTATWADPFLAAKLPAALLAAALEETHGDDEAPTPAETPDAKHEGAGGTPIVIEGDGDELVAGDDDDDEHGRSA